MQCGMVGCNRFQPTGIEVTGDMLRLRLKPQLPQGMDRLDMRIRYRGHSLDVRLTCASLIVRGRDRGPVPIRLGFKNDVHEFSGGTRAFMLE